MPHATVEVPFHYKSCAWEVTDDCGHSVASASRKGLIDSDKRDERQKEDELRKEAEAYVRASDSRLDEIRSELKKDEILKVVIHHVEHGWLEKRRDVYGQMTKFWNERGNLTVHEGLLLRGKQI